ncbi:MAG: M20/M25/M40 family metallo-hydrolase [Hymenobacteraceae bacterium]|nr:M20/M25/M40 family metallo-hydrolase [Hymenobacteraceae bacterium]
MLFFRPATAALLALAPFAVLAQPGKPAPTKPETDPIARIKEEGMNHSQVMKTLSYLTDNLGPRVTGSPALHHANEWTRDELTRHGLVNAKLEAWGPFGRGWSLTSYTGEVLTPTVQPLQAYPKAWAPGCNLQNAEVVWVNAATVADLEKYRGKLRGKVVLSGPMREIKPHFEAEASRRTDKELLDLADAPDPTDIKPGNPKPSPLREREAKKRYFLGAARAQFYVTEGVALILDPSRAGDGGNIFVQQASGASPVDTTSMETMYNSGAHVWDLKPPTVLPQAAVSVEQYNHLVRMLQSGQPVRMNVKTAVEFHDKDLMQYNTVAEIPGTDKKDEVVMLGGHLDSWQGGTGATDNAAGVAVAMEAVRILKTLGLTPRRTIRVALWTGEEQGIYGSEAYVQQHFGEQVKEEGTAGRAGGLARVTVKPEHAKLSAYFNLDNGAGKIRGVYMQGNDAVRPIFRKWLAPFKDLGATTLTLDNTGGTDHLSFDAVGLPGFQFIQDELEYFSRTHHSTQDVFDRAPPEDMKQAATIMAAFVYQTAMRDEMLPRKPVTVVKDGAKKAGKKQKVKA